MKIMKKIVSFVILLAIVVGILAGCNTKVDKSFPSVKALKGVSLGIRPGEEADLGDENNFIDTGYEIVDINNYEEVWASKIPW